ncbi:MAG: hypothetical protein ACXACU_09420 [Candidatus Hodarchaeales archaeon]|jgi:hypothetical protein
MEKEYLNQVLSKEERKNKRMRRLGERNCSGLYWNMELKRFI